MSLPDSSISSSVKSPGGDGKNDGSSVEIGYLLLVRGDGGVAVEKLRENLLDDGGAGVLRNLPGEVWTGGGLPGVEGSYDLDEKNANYRLFYSDRCVV